MNNIILEIIMLEIMNDIVDKKLNYNFILDNFDTLINKKDFNNLLNDFFSGYSL